MGHDLVYKLGEDLLVEHPGGPDVVTAFAGKDATHDFELIVHSDDAREWADKYIIGYIEGADEEVKMGATPTNKDVASRGSKGGGMDGLLPAVAAGSALMLVGLIGYVASK